MFALSHVLVGGLLRFPSDWDTLMYHLPLTNHWLQAGSLYAPDCQRWSDAGNNEILALWVVAPFSGDFLSALNNLPAVVLLVCSAFELGRHLGLDEPHRHLVSLAVAANFVVLRQLTDAENDVAVAALLLSCLAYGIRYAARGAAADLALGSVAFGLLAGIKFYALGYAAVAALLLAPLIAWRRGSRTAARACLAGAVGSLTFGGYWYLRNWLASGTPFYPLWATPGADEMSWSYPALWESTFAGNGSPGLLHLAVEAVWSMTGPCQLAALLALPVSLIWLSVSSWYLVVSGRSSPVAARLMLAAATLASGLVLMVTPFAVEDSPGTLNQMHWKYCPVRYGLCFLSLAMLSSAVLLNDLVRGLTAAAGGLARLLEAAHARRAWALSPRWIAVPAATMRGMTLLLVTACIGYQLFARYERLHIDLTDVVLAGANALLLVFLASLAVAVLHRQSRHRIAAGLVIGVLCVGLGVGVLSDQWHQGHAAHFDRMLGHGVFARIARDVPPGSQVCVLDLRPYPFFGSARQYHVCQPPNIRSRQGWTDYLRSRHVALVAARFDSNYASCNWRHTMPYFNDQPDLFQPLEVSGSAYTIYRVNGQAWNAATASAPMSPLAPPAR